MCGDRRRPVAARRGRIQRLRRFPGSCVGYARILTQKIESARAEECYLFWPARFRNALRLFLLLQQAADDSAKLALLRDLELIERRFAQAAESRNVRNHARICRRPFDSKRQAATLAEKRQLGQLRQRA